ncbi:TIGR03545 family protein [Spongiibacter tropicus]|uniref:TIGR03545 family protein n=1 Tax=Spongiibacter tropicus TaxID=454602 RepID=UPI00235573AE|nr:TIGR03545 family protein [Spongiibacter tropicus]
MLKWIPRVLLLLVVLVIATVLFAMEPIAKWAIESEGSKAVGARVTVDSVDIKLYPTHVALNGLTVANPQEPMRNLLESERISADVDTKALLKQQVIADQVLLSGLQLYTERSTPGTLDGSMPPPKPEQEGSGMPSITLPDANAIMSEEQAIIQAEVNDIENGFKSLESKWQEKSKTLPKEETFNEFKQRWEALKKKNTLERLAGAKQLRDDIKDELKQFKGLNKELGADIDMAKSLTQRAAKLPSVQSQRIMSKYGIDQGTEGMLRFLVGDEATAMVQRGLTLYRETVGDLTSKEPEPTQPEASSELPVNILIREILIDGYQMVGEEKLAYSGEIRDVTDKQDYWNKPITMLLKGGVNNASQLQIDGIFDQRGDALKSAFNMALKQLALSGISLSQSPQLPLQLEKGLADINANFAVDGSDLSGSVKGLVNQAKLLVANASSENDTAQRLAKALESVSKLVMNLNVGGSVSDPIVKLKSNLDSIIGDVLGEELKGQLKEVEADVKTKIQSKYGDDLNRLQEKRELLADYQSLLGDREAALQAIMKELM